MTATLCATLLRNQGWLPLIQSVRHGSKAVTRHKKPLHILKQKLLAVTQYMPPVRPVAPGAYPSKNKHVQEDNGFTLLLKKDLKKVFEECKMIAVVTRSFLSDSVYCNMAPLFIGPTVLFVSKEPKVKEMLSALKASPQMTLLGRFYSCFQRATLLY
ncbi:hypothetical protein GOODEAATRI_027676 [Goodea atripinnis]|uniref:Large ribosomal subunit protein uL10m n=1 Tax=Goodea atripinnis TaxID=208336 RepID=A0ABV0N750_9TELE